MAYDHVLMTPFNIRRRGVEGRGTDADWLAHRMPYFEKVCAPSVVNQTLRAFRWFIFVDPATPPEHLDRIAAAAAPVDHELVPVERYEDMASATADRTPAPRLTSRLDNDDALERTHIERIQAAIEAGANTVVFTTGVVLMAESGLTYRLRQRHSPFCSFLTSDPALTAATCEQDEVFKHPPAAELPDGFLRVLHGRNMWGTAGAIERRVPADQVLERYAIDPSLLRDDRGPRKWIDVGTSLCREKAGRAKVRASLIRHGRRS